MMTKDIVTVVTHSGAFHADEIFACATISLYFKDKEIQITRSRDVALFEAVDVVVDVGHIYDPERYRFDHHQKEGAGKRENGIPYASFGLVWKQFGTQLCTPQAMRIIDTEMACPIDAGDNGVEISNNLFEDVSPYRFSSVVSAFNSSWQEDAEKINNENFFKMLSWAKDILSREIMQAETVVAAEKEVELIYRNTADKRLIVLDSPYPAKDVIRNFPEPLYIIRPRSDGAWGLTAVRNKGESFVNRKDLPESWSGLEGTEFRKVTGVSDAIFCHRARFLAAAASKDGALALAKIALES